MGRWALSTWGASRFTQNLRGFPGPAAVPGGAGPDVPPTDRKRSSGPGQLPRPPPALCVERSGGSGTKEGTGHYCSLGVFP